MKKENKRNLEMLRMYLSGNTFEQIGRVYGVSRQRAHYIVKKELNRLSPALPKTTISMVDKN